MRKNLKKYFLALAVIAVIAVTAGASVYLWIYRVKIDGNSKIILSYFENAQVQTVDEYEYKEDSELYEPALDNEVARLPNLLTYKGREYAVWHIKVSKGQLAAGEGEENIHELKDISYKLAVVYEYENEYYLYKYFNEEQPIDPEETFKDLIQEITQQNQIEFYDMVIYLDEYDSRLSDDDDYKLREIHCKGDFKQFFEECLLKEYGSIINCGEYAVRGRMTNVKRMKTASIALYGYMPLGITISIDFGFVQNRMNVSDGESMFGRSYQITEEQLERTCQYIKDNFELYEVKE